MPWRALMIFAVFRLILSGRVKVRARGYRLNLIARKELSIYVRKGSSGTVVRSLVAEPVEPSSKSIKCGVEQLELLYFVDWSDVLRRLGTPFGSVFLELLALHHLLHAQFQEGRRRFRTVLVLVNEFPRKGSYCFFHSLESTFLLSVNLGEKVRRRSELGRRRVGRKFCGLEGELEQVGSTVGPCPEGGVELEDARFGPLSRANSSAMLVVMLATSWLTVPSSAAMREWSSEVDDAGETRGRGAPEDVGGGRCVEGAPEYAGITPAGVGGGGVCVGGG
ncbi:hypothetical protein CRG98_012533 [Punica granatum]|uniref:Uncharacterized protein n=1 Tax=Punica granatum TaxID=22663 RepID=A0A2I0KEX7_PUNGR|nr:hypothetical protein CRG98_012533 [Punica granatum]